MDEWLEEDPALVSPEYYLHEYSSCLHAIDNFSSEKSHARLVQQILENMDLSSYLHIHNTTFKGYSKKLDPSIFPFDFIWFDCGGPSTYEDFLNEYWSRIDPDGGYLLLHCTLNRSGLHNVLNYLKLRQAAGGLLEFELLSLQESHKLTNDLFSGRS